MSKKKKRLSTEKLVKLIIEVVIALATLITAIGNLFK